MNETAKSLESALRRWESMMVTERTLDRQFAAMPSELVEENAVKLLALKRDRCGVRNEIQGLIELVANSVGSAEQKADLWQLHEAIGRELAAMPSLSRVFGILRSIEDAQATKSDTKNDTAKKIKKKRLMNIKAIDCCRRYKADKGRTPMKVIVEDYIEEHGGSFGSIMRTLNDNPDQWKKDDTEAT